MKMWVLIAILMLMAMPISAYSVDFTVGCLGNVTAGSCICRTGVSCTPTTCGTPTCPSRTNTTKSSACTQSRTNNCGSFSPPNCDSGTCSCAISGGVCNYNCLSGWHNCDGNNDNGCECSGILWSDYGSNVTNNTNITAGTTILIYANWTQIGGTPSMYLISNMTNDSGTWYNSSWYDFSGGRWSNISVVYPSDAIEGNITFKIYANGTSNLQNVTTISFFYNHTIEIPPPPNSPSYLNVIAVSDYQINLDWDDNSNNEDGFGILRSLDGLSFNHIADVGTDVIFYNDTGLNSSTVYYYEVYAFNLTTGNSSYVYGNGMTFSPPSKAKCEYFCYPFKEVNDKEEFEILQKKELILGNKYFIENLQNEETEDSCNIFWYNSDVKDRNFCINLYSRKAIILSEINENNNTGFIDWIMSVFHSIFG